MTTRFFSTHCVHAWPEWRDGEEGYSVKAIDGHIYWLPKITFEDTYRKSGEMNFGHALCALFDGYKVARSGWNGKGMFLYYVPGSRFEVNRPPLLGIYPEGKVIEYHPHVDMMTAQGYAVPWLCSQADMQAADWMIVEGLTS